MIICMKEPGAFAAVTMIVPGSKHFLSHAAVNLKTGSLAHFREKGVRSYFFGDSSQLNHCRPGIIRKEKDCNGIPPDYGKII